VDIEVRRISDTILTPPLQESGPDPDYAVQTSARTTVLLAAFALRGTWQLQNDYENGDLDYAQGGYSS